MKITDSRDATLQLIQQYQKNEAAKGPAGKSGSPAVLVPEEKVAISDQAREFRDIKAIVDAMPDILEEKVQALQRQIDNGSYRVSAGEIAGKIVGENLLDIYA